MIDAAHTWSDEDAAWLLASFLFSFHVHVMMSDTDSALRKRLQALIAPLPETLRASTRMLANASR